MLKKLISKDLSPACAYCSHGRLSADGDSVLCVKQGIMRLQSNCKKYKYDPLKRQPQKPPVLPEYSAEEFEL